MPKIKIETNVSAPPDRVFDLARCIGLHAESMGATEERAIAGRTSGLIDFGESVTWEATHFGVRQQLTSKITKFDRPRHFRDEMISGAFRSFVHDHFFESRNGITLMTDFFEYSSPLGILGRIADSLFLEGYMRGLLTSRNELIRKVAESDDWRRFLTDED